MNLMVYFTANQNEFGVMGPPGTPAQGTGTFNRFGTGWDELGGGGLNPGGQGFQTIIHELGHSLGLKHPHDDGPGGRPIYEGVTSAFDDYGAFNQNQGIYTMMSHNQGWATGPVGSRPDAAGLYGRAGTPMAFDIAVLQAKYGANTTFADGSTTYTLPDRNAVGTYWACIWDTGGTDTIIYNGTRTAVIDLNMASLAHTADGGGRLSNAAGVAGGFTIANSVRIENATGGNGIDRLNGNAFNNVLTGRNGNDVLVGAGGTDTLIGGPGNDLYYLENGPDNVVDSVGIDTISSTISRTLLGLYAEVENLTLSAGTINGVGNNASNVITGGLGNNILSGGIGNDVLRGLNGNDKLLGGLGNDSLTGGLNNDTFVFNTAPNTAANRDLITDFNHVADTIQLENAVFTKLTVGGVLNPALFWNGTAAHDSNDFIIYNRASGALYYDPNGNLPGGAVMFAVLTTRPAIAANDFVVI